LILACLTILFGYATYSTSLPSANTSANSTSPTPTVNAATGIAQLPSLTSSAQATPTPTATPSPSPTPTPQPTQISYPQLSSSYTGNADNITLNQTGKFDLENIQEDSNGNISGNDVVSLPLYGTGTFTGKVTLQSVITFTVTPQDSADSSKINFTGTVSGTTLRGTYTSSSGEGGNWQVVATS
jgi:hypothetical protein